MCPAISNLSSTSQSLRGHLGVGNECYQRVYSLNDSRLHNKDSCMVELLHTPLQNLPPYLHVHNVQNNMRMEASMFHLH